MVFAAAIVNCRACRRWCKAAHRRLVCARRSTGTCLMTLWFVFALMTAAAIFAVLWPLSRGSRPQTERQRGHRLQGSARRGRTRRRRGPDRRPRSGSRAGRDQPPAAGGGGRPARPAGRGRTQVCAARRRSSRWWDCRSRRWRSICRWDRRSLAIFRLPRAPAPPTPSSRSTTWWRRSKRIWKKIRPTAAAGPCWRRCWRVSAASMMRSAPIAIRSPTTATARSAAPISAKPLLARRAASSRRRPRPSSSARSR